MIRQPICVDLRGVPCQMIGFDGDYDVERLVSEMVTAIDQASFILQETKLISASVTRNAAAKLLTVPTMMISL